MTEKTSFLRHRGPRAAAAAGILVVALIAWSALSVIFAPAPKKSEATPGWGQEATRDLGGRIAALSPIAAANACGMGASSCFKCHNGQRAPAPVADKENGPWHADHKSVNNSCVGCHKGNPRLIKQSLAHADLLVDAREKPAETCKTCHSTGNDAELLKLYIK